MPKKSDRDSKSADHDDMLPHYDFDYSKARPNRFAQPEGREVLAVTLDPDVAKVFGTPKKVNAALRSLIPSAAQTKKKVAGRPKAEK